ncbi:MAG: NAD-dependent epimerase/dehydratase family protein [Granulosicoccus sp.]
MRVLVTGSSGHLGEALMRVLGQHPDLLLTGLDIKPSAFTNAVGSVHDAGFVNTCMAGVDVIYHTATLHKPHVATHSKQDFFDVNVSGTLALLEAAVAHGVSRFIFTSTTSVFGDAMRPEPGQPAVWVTEDLQPLPKNIYGVTKFAAEDLCHLFHRQTSLNCIILRTSRFFPEEDDDCKKRNSYADANCKANEFLYRRVELQDVVDAHLKAAERAVDLGFGRYIISATTAFLPEDLQLLNVNAREVVLQRIPEFKDAYSALGWTMFDRIDRVYVNTSARDDLGWEPQYDYRRILHMCRKQETAKSKLAIAVGCKGYHDRAFAEGPYPVDM